MSQTKDKYRSKLRERADDIKEFRCKNLIAVLENPNDSKNLATTIRNVNALGVEKLYVVDSRKLFPDDWEQLRRDFPKHCVTAYNP